MGRAFFSYRRKRLCGLLLLLLASRRRNRRVWVKDSLLRTSREGFSETNTNESASEELDLYKTLILMDPTMFTDLLKRVAPRITKCNTLMRESISAAERLALTLRFLATGERYSSLQFQFRVSPASISNIVPAVCDAIWQELKDEFVRLPKDESEWRCVAKDFSERWNVPNCIGAVDGKHIMISPPAGTGGHYLNGNGTFSIVLMALVDANYNFTFVDVATNGRVSDRGVWNKSTLKNLIDQEQLNVPTAQALPGRDVPVPFIILADQGFTIQPYMMVRYPSYEECQPAKRVFNYRLSRGRRIAENAFGVLASRFEVFSRPMRLSPAKAKLVVLACCALHNYLRSRTSSCALYSPQGSFDFDDIDAGKFVDGEWREKGFPASVPSLVHNGGRPTLTAQSVRQEFTSYFNSEIGAVSWQWNRVQ